MASDRVEIEFDHHALEYAEHGPEIEEGLRRKCPVAWSSRHGGFWAVSGHGAVSAVLRDRERTGTAKSIRTDGTAVGGIIIPPHPGEYVLNPLEIDPPEWNGYRKVLNPAFSPSAIAARRSRIEDFAAHVINRVIENGEADLVLDIASPVTALVTLDILGLPLGDWEFYADPIHRLPYEPLEPRVQEGISAALGRLGETVAQRRGKAQGGLINDLIDARIDGQAMSDRTIVNILWMLLVGGLDTTNGLLAWAALHFDDDRSEHRRFIDDEAFRRTATEELVRWVSPAISNARTARQDMEIEGQSIHCGDRLLIMFRSANRDPQVFDEPDLVNLSRFPNRHFGFGTGIHRCLGSNLARAVFQVVMSQILHRMPDYTVDRDRARPFPRRQNNNGWINMPIRFSPGPAITTGVSFDF